MTLLASKTRGRRSANHPGLFFSLILTSLAAGLVSGCGTVGLGVSDRGSSGSSESASHGGAYANGSRPRQETLDQLKRADEAIRTDALNPAHHLDKARTAIDLATGEQDAKSRLAWYGELRTAVEGFERVPASVRRSEDATLDSLLFSAWTLEMESALAAVDGRWSDLADRPEQSGLALNHLENAMMILPERSEAYEMAGSLLYRTDQPKRALGVLLQGVAMSEGDVTNSYREKLSYIHLQLGEMEEAVLALEPAVSEGNPSRQTLFAYVNSLILSGRSMEAIEWLEVLVEEDPSNGDARNTLASETASLIVALSQNLLERGDDLDLNERIAELERHADRFESLMAEIAKAPDPNDDHIYVVGEALDHAAGRLESMLPSVPETERSSVLGLSQRLYRQALPLWKRLYESRPECEEAFTTLLGIYRSLGMAREARDLQLNHQG